MYQVLLQQYITTALLFCPSLPLFSSYLPSPPTPPLSLSLSPPPPLFSSLFLFPISSLSPSPPLLSLSPPPPPPLYLSFSLPSPPPSSPPQLYKQTVHSTVAEFIPLTMKTIILQPSAKARQAPDFNREAYVDFVAVQIKFLSFLAYIIRIYQDQVHFSCVLSCFCSQERVRKREREQKL